MRDCAATSPPLRLRRSPANAYSLSKFAAKTRPHRVACGVRCRRRVASAARTTGVVYERRRPEKTTLYEIVRDNVETLYGAIDDGAIAVRIPKHAKKEIEAYLDCGLLCRGFARLRCERCEESRLVAFSCKGRGFCPSCLVRRMCSTAANLIEDVLPEVAHRPWGVTSPFPWRRRLAQDGALFGVLTRIFVESVERAGRIASVSRRSPGSGGAARPGFGPPHGNAAPAAARRARASSSQRRHGQRGAVYSPLGLPPMSAAVVVTRNRTSALSIARISSVPEPKSVPPPIGQSSGAGE
ncbi:transposase zinc-binding domain-containing protein [Sorangium sp. So ce119]|uniref:transposase zinc-binding domain-containing protein n=1 Tax=Sorangium sp. So ce119 TaxID=3133279 RepID=UPI003F617520